MLIDKHLSWNDNTNHICKKITAGISALLRLKEYADKHTLLSVYNALIYPYFSIGEAQSKCLQKLQNRAARIIKNLGNNVDHTFALHELGWGPLTDDRRKIKAKMMYKVLNKLGPTSLGNLFTYKDEVTCYNLWDVSSSLYLPKPRTNNMKKSFMYDWAFQWNSIPKEINSYLH